MNWAQFHKTASARHGLWVMPLAVLLMVLVQLASCTTHDGYLHYQSLRVSGWEYRDSAAFVVDSLPTSGTRHLTIALRKSSAHVYPLHQFDDCRAPNLEVGRQHVGQSHRHARLHLPPSRRNGRAPRECRSILTNFLSALSHCLLTPQGVWSSAI